MEWSSYSLTLQPLPASTKLEMGDSRLDHYYVGKKCRVRHLRKLRLHWCKHQSVETTNVRIYFIMKKCKRRAHLITWLELAGLLIIWEDSFLRSGLRIARNEIFLCWVIRVAQDFNWSIITFKNTGRNTYIVGRQRLLQLNVAAYHEAVGADLCLRCLGSPKNNHSVTSDREQKYGR